MVCQVAKPNASPEQISSATSVTFVVAQQGLITAPSYSQLIGEGTKCSKVAVILTSKILAVHSPLTIAPQSPPVTKVVLTPPALNVFG